MAPKIQCFYHMSATLINKVDKPSVSEPVEFVKLSAKMGHSKRASWARLGKKGRAEREFNRK